MRAQRGTGQTERGTGSWPCRGLQVELEQHPWFLWDRAWDLVTAKQRPSSWTGATTPDFCRTAPHTHVRVDAYASFPLLLQNHQPSFSYWKRAVISATTFCWTDPRVRPKVFLSPSQRLFPKRPPLPAKRSFYFIFVRNLWAVIVIFITQEEIGAEKGYVTYPSSQNGK